MGAYEKYLADMRAQRAAKNAEQRNTATKQAEARNAKNGR